MEPNGKNVKDDDRYKKVRRNKKTPENQGSGNVEKVEDATAVVAKDETVVEEKQEKQDKQDKKVKKATGKFAGNEKTEMLNTLVNNLYDIQKVRIAVENRNRALQEKSKELIFNDHASRMKKLEKDTVKEIGFEISKFKISEWMLGQRGIGPSLAGQTIAIIRDVGRFSNV